MAHTFRTIILITVLTTTGAATVGSGFASADSERTGGYRSSRIVESRSQISTPGTPEVTTPARVETEPLTDDEQALVHWAIDRFARAGLELPEMAVRFDPSRELCGGAEGLYQQTAEGERIVTICIRDSDSFAAQLERRRTLLHEFGHAWDYANLTSDDRQELARILGADDWNDPLVAWADRGVERFAETFVFALLDQPARQLKVSLECSALIDAFRTATGAEPQGPGLPSCAT